MNIKESKDLMERMGLLAPEMKLRRNIFEHYTSIDEILEEGIFTSHSAETIYKILKKNLNIHVIESPEYKPKENEIGIQFDAYKDSDKSYGTDEVSLISIVVSKDFEKIEKIKQFFNMCGWVLSETIDYPHDSSFSVYTFEKRKESDALPLPEYLYHITPENKVPKILKNGLEPKTNNKLSEHPERIYFFLTKDLTLNYKSYADSFWSSTHGQKPRSERYTLLKINTEKCRPGFKIYGDPNMVRGVWSFDNVPPEAITIEEEGI